MGVNNAKKILLRVIFIRIPQKLKLIVFLFNHFFIYVFLLVSWISLNLKIKNKKLPEVLGHLTIALYWKWTTKLNKVKTYWKWTTKLNKVKT